MIRSFSLIFLFLITIDANTRVKSQIFNDSLALWNLFRDPENGAYCDTIRFDPAIPCGSQNNRYSSAGTGMGLVMTTIMAEVKYTNRTVAESQIIQTLNTVTNLWPKDSHTGFLIHFTNRNFQNNPKVGYSTVDSAELVLGALFAANYFKGEALKLATSLRDSIDWSAALKGATDPQIYSLVNITTGKMYGNIRPYNEYYLVAYLALLTSPDNESKAFQYFNTYMATDGGEPVGDNGYPVHKEYYQYDLLTDQPSKFMSSFIPQFCYFLSKNFQINPYYQQMLHSWFLADQLYYSKEIKANSTVWGVPVQGRLFGAGAGPGISGYSVQRINGSHKNVITSAAIMSGFLPTTAGYERSTLNKQLKWLYKNNVCAYPIAVEDSTIKILWRCSVKVQDWHCPSVDSIDYSTFTLGYATNFVSQDFFLKYAA